MALGSAQLVTELSTKNISWEVKAALRGADNLTTLMFRVSLNLGFLTSWNPLGLSRPVMGLLYLFTVHNLVVPYDVAPGICAPLYIGYTARGQGSRSEKLASNLQSSA